MTGVQTCALPIYNKYLLCNNINKINNLWLLNRFVVDCDNLMLIQDCNLNYFIGIFYKCQNKSNIYPIELEDKKINLCNMNIKYMKDNKKHKEVIFNQLHLIKLNKFLYNVESSDKYEIYHLIKSYIHFNKFTNIKELKKNIQIINSNEQFINIIIDIKQDKSITDEKIKNFIDKRE